MPLAAKLAPPVDRVSSEQQLRLAIGLALRDQPELESLLQEIYDPASPKFHQYLTPQQFAARFGPTPEQYSNVIQFALSHHLKVLEQHPNRTVLDVGGSAADIEKTFGIHLNLYSHPKEKRMFYAPDVEPVTPATLPILHISGLDNFLVPRPAGLTRSASGAAMPLSGAGPGGSFRGSDFRGAYARGVSLTGTGQMVGLLEFDGYYPSDIASYQSQTSEPSVPLIDVTLDGFDGTPAGNNPEVSLDIEMVSAMAPGLSAIIVYEGGPGGLADDILNRMATDNLARQLSSSWTFSIDATTEQIFLQFAAQGQTYFNASGDGGAYTGAVDTPADDPNVTVVGGTTMMTTGPGGALTNEIVWNRNSSPVAATGGGISTKYPIPSWQQPVNMSVNKGSTTLRNLPDVAAVADSVWITYGNGNEESVGGTSCSSPLWAGFIALVNQQGAGFGRPPVGFLNPAIYSLGLSAGYSTNFHDITIGDNTTSTSPSKFLAVPGYDLCTGWGSPFGQNLINALAPRFPFPLLTNVSATIIQEGCSPGNKALDPGETVTVSFVLKNVGGVKTTNLVATLVGDDSVRWPGVAQNYGALTSGGAASRNFTFTANGTCGAGIAATLLLQDGTADLGKIVFNFNLGTPIIVLTQNFDSVVAPALPAGWSTMASNGVSPWVTSTTWHDSPANAVFADEPVSPGVEDLISPAIPIASASAQISFRQFYNTEADPAVASEAYDGGLLEIQIGTNDFVELTAAGGSFVAGGYDHTITTQTNSDNPFKGRQVWGGNSGGFTTTTATLPAIAAGQTVRFRWRFAVDTENFFGGFGWYIDSVSVRDGADCCNPVADLAVLGSVSPEPVPPGQPLSYSVSVTNLGPGSAYGVMVTNVLPQGVAFGSGSAGCTFTNGLVLCDAGTLPAGAATNYSFSVSTTSLNSITNLIAVWAFTPDSNQSNNQLMAVSSVAGSGSPIVFVQPTNTVSVQGGTATLQATAFGTTPFAYQWLFQGGPLAGQTTQSLSLTNLQVQQSGSYSVVVTNIDGSIESGPVRLLIVVPPSIRITSLGAIDGMLTVSLPGVAGLAYTLEYKNSLNDPLWIPILPATPGTGTPVSLIDSNAAGLPARFYRVTAQ